MQNKVCCADKFINILVPYKMNQKNFKALMLLIILSLYPLIISKSILLRGMVSCFVFEVRYTLTLSQGCSEGQVGNAGNNAGLMPTNPHFLCHPYTALLVAIFQKSQN